MSPEKSVSIFETLQDLTFQEISAIILPVLVSGEVLHESDVELIRTLAVRALEADVDLSIQDALIGAAGDRLKARENLAPDQFAVVDHSGLVHSVVQAGKVHEAMSGTAIDEREHRDHSNSN